MFFEEFQDSLAFIDREIHIIRDNKGFYFIAGSNFKNVYDVLKQYLPSKSKQSIEILLEFSWVMLWFL